MSSVAVAGPRVRSRRRTGAHRLVLVGGPALALALGILSILIGVESLPPRAILDVLRGAGGDGVVPAIVGSRVDRTVLAVVVGIACALSGAVLQGLTRNPLADPGILGFNAGASLAIVLGIAYAGMSTPRQYVWVAALGVLVPGALAATIALVVPPSRVPVTMTLAGAGLTACATSIVSAVIVLRQDAFDSFRFWQIGSVAGRPLTNVLEIAPFLIVGLLLCLTSRGLLDALAMGEDLARALGHGVVVRGALAAVGAMLLAAAAVALAGPIAFVGLVVPHLVRALVGPAYGLVLAHCLWAGPVVLLAADLLGRVVARPEEIRSGLLVALVGGPVLILLVRRMKLA